MPIGIKPRKLPTRPRINGRSLSSQGDRSVRDAQWRMTDKTEADLLPWILGGLVAVIAVVGLIVALINRDDSEVRSPTIRPATESVAPNPTPSRPAHVVSGAMPMVGTPRRVWECVANGQKIFSDAPCGVGSTIRELSPINRMNPTRAPPSTTYNTNPPDPGYAAPTYELPYSNESANNAGTCEALDAEVKAINERMRHHYTNPEGEYYRDRLHKISDRKYDLHCDR
jgi:hypothetical protein